MPDNWTPEYSASSDDPPVYDQVEEVAPDNSSDSSSESSADTDASTQALYGGD
jgi:hypothetical protein